MKAVRIHEFGDESVLRYEDAPDPTIGPDEVLISVKAAALNRGDLGRRSRPGQNLVLPFIIGWDVAGDITALGANVTGLRPGQRVVSLLPAGGYAELAAATADLTVALPDSVTYEQAASLPVAYMTAWIALLDTCALQPGETCLVQAASSGVGMAGVGIAKYVGGARLVITAAGTDEKVARAKELGADHAINYSTGDFLGETLRLTAGRGVDVCLEVVGGDVFARSQQALAEGGRMVSAGRSSATAPEVDEDLATRKHQMVATSWGAMGGASTEVRARALSRIVDLVAEGTLKVVIDRVFPLSEAADAHRYLGGRNQFGKVLLAP
jgi:NADPH2:quinone reductase